MCTGNESPIKHFSLEKEGCVMHNLSQLVIPCIQHYSGLSQVKMGYLVKIVGCPK